MEIKKITGKVSTQIFFLLGKLLQSKFPQEISRSRILKRIKGLNYKASSFEYHISKIHNLCKKKKNYHATAFKNTSEKL